jgi:hypothetical protein
MLQWACCTDRDTVPIIQACIRKRLERIVWERIAVIALPPMDEGSANGIGALFSCPQVVRCRKSASVGTEGKDTPKYKDESDR